MQNIDILDNYQCFKIYKFDKLIKTESYYIIEKLIVKKYGNTNLSRLRQFLFN